MKKLALSKLLMLSAVALFLTSCTSDEIQSENTKLDQSELNVDFQQKDMDSLTPNQGEPIIVRPPRN